MNTLKRVAAIHDISGFGKCSLTVALPILSAAGIETSVLPTAVLSTHTGGFTGFTYRDLTDDIAPITDHWKSLDLRFDAIYTGFLGSFQQLDLVARFFDMFKTPENTILVDPVMADNGELYSIFTPAFAEGMRRICQKADIILPNLTEAALLTRQPYRPGPYSPAYIEDLLGKLADLGPKKIVLTGVFFDDRDLGAATYDADTQSVDYAFETRIDGYYHGTGDVFGSALLAAYMNNFSLDESAALAAEFTASAIQKTATAGTDIRFGVNFEQSLPEFLRELGLV
jgi:pyridoxine kinase